MTLKTARKAGKIKKENKEIRNCNKFLKEAKKDYLKNWQYVQNIAKQTLSCPLYGSEIQNRLTLLGNLVGCEA